MFHFHMQSFRIRRARMAPAAAVLAAVVAAGIGPARAQCPNENHVWMADNSMNAQLGYVDRLTNLFNTAPAAIPSSAGTEGIDLNRSLTTAYVALSNSGWLLAINLTTGQGTVINSFLSGPRGVELNAAETAAWVTEETAGRLVSVNLATGVSTTVATGLSAPRGFAVDSTETYAYVAESSSGNVVRVDLASGMVFPGGGSGIAAPRDVAINAADSQLYVTDTTAGALYKVSPFGGMATLVASGLLSPIGVAVNAAETSAFVAENAGQLTEVALPSGVKTVLNPSLASPSGLDLNSSPCQNATLSPSTQAPGTGSRIAVCLHIDMRNSSETLGSYGATLSWDPNILGFVTATGGDAPFDTPVINTTNAASGALSAADADATGAAGAPHLLCAEFDVDGPTASSSLIDLGLTSITGAGTFNDLASSAVVNDLTIDVQGLCVVGDVNGNTFVNSGDALIILSHEIMLPIPGGLQAFIDAGCGDANGDSLTDSLDSNIVLTSEVGLPLDPNFPVNTPLQTFESCPSCSAPPPAAAPLEPPSLEAAGATGPVITSRLSFSTVKPKKGDLFEVVVRVDMEVSGLELGSYGAHLRWPAGVVEYAGIVRSAGPAFPSPLVNDREAGQGILRFAQADPSGAGGDVELVRLRFRAHHALPHLERIFFLGFSSMGSTGPAFRALLPFVVHEEPQRASPAP